jgi:DNA-binding response OmpR family regulator
MTPELIGRRILVVEDELLISCLLEDMLEDLGCTLVGPASRVDQALRLVATEVIDAVVLDVSLDQELSYPVADALVVRGVPFLFSTGYDRDRLRDGYRSFAMLQKPFHPSELARVLIGLFQGSAPCPARLDACHDAKTERDGGARPIVVPIAG